MLLGMGNKNNMQRSIVHNIMKNFHLCTRSYEYSYNLYTSLDRDSDDFDIEIHSIDSWYKRMII